MSKKLLKRMIERRMSSLRIHKQRVVYAYAHTLLFYRRLREGDLHGFPMDRPAPGKIVPTLMQILDGATARELVCVLKFTRKARKINGIPAQF
jgi:hypothetical protein